MISELELAERRGRMTLGQRVAARRALDAEQGITYPVPTDALADRLARLLDTDRK